MQVSAVPDKAAFRPGIRAGTWVTLPGSGPRGHGAVQAEFAEAFEAIGLKCLEDFFKVAGEPLTKPGLGTRYRARLQLEQGGVSRPVYLKRFGKGRFFERCLRFLEGGKARTAGEHEMRVAASLQDGGIPVPEPVAWGWKQNGRLQRSSFVVLSAVPGKPLSLWLQEHPAHTTVEGRRRKRELLLQIAALVRQFHRMGWRHRDLYLCHLFVNERLEGFQLSLIDLQRAFRPRWRKLRWQLKDLAQLNYSAMAENIQPFTRLRFARLYLGEKFAPPDRRLLRRVQRKSNRIARREEPRIKFVLKPQANESGLAR